MTLFMFTVTQELGQQQWWKKENNREWKLKYKKNEEHKNPQTQLEIEHCHWN